MSSADSLLAALGLIGTRSVSDSVQGAAAWFQYTLEEEANMNRGMDHCLAISRTRVVPTTFTC
jgi:hypothetical protein